MQCKGENKRNPAYNVDPAAINRIDYKTLLSIYQKITTTRCFELEVAQAVKEKRIPSPVYLSLGQEAVAAAVSELISGYLIFTQHRAHGWYLDIGADPKMLRDELLGLPTGTSHGRGGSSNLQYLSDSIYFYGHNSLIGENVPQAAGAALASHQKTVSVFGDGAAEEDYVIETLGFAATKQIPMLFICEDNGLSILTKTNARRSWELVDVARGFGVEAYDLADCPWSLYERISQWDGVHPMLLNCRVCRERWHVGIGIDGEREWKRNEIVREQLIQKGLRTQVESIEDNAVREAAALWKR